MDGRYHLWTRVDMLRKMAQVERSYDGSRPSDECERLEIEALLYGADVEGCALADFHLNEDEQVSMFTPGYMLNVLPMRDRDMLLGHLLNCPHCVTAVLDRAEEHGHVVRHGELARAA